MKPKLKVLILTWECYPVFVGGLGVLVKDLVAELKNQGVEVTLLMPYIPAELALEHAHSLQRQTKKYLNKKPYIEGLDFNVNVFEANRTRYERFFSWCSIFHRKVVSSPTHQIYSNDTPKITRAFAFSVWGWLVKHKKLDYFDCILGMDWLTIPTFKLLKNFRNPTPFIFYINSTEYERNLDSAKRSKISQEILDFETRFFGLADHIVAVSEITKQVLVQQLRVAANKITVVFNDTSFQPSTNTYKLPSQNKYVLFLGRLANQKGLYFLVDTAQKVVEIDPNVHFLIAGDGEILPKVVTQVVEKELEKNVHFLGWTNSEQKKVLYNTSDLFVMPSPSEPFGLTALEAIKSGVPVIASKNCGFVNLVKSTPTFTYHDTQTFTHLILSLLYNPQELKALVIRQQNDLANHSWSREVAKLVALIELFKAS